MRMQRYPQFTVHNMQHKVQARKVYNAVPLLYGALVLVGVALVQHLLGL